MTKALLLSLVLAAPLAAADPNAALLRAPEGLKAEWAFGPGPALDPQARFVAGAKRLWLLAKPGFLVSNDKMGLSLLFQATDLEQDGDGKLWLSSPSAAGSLAIAPDGRSAALKRTLLLPSPAWRLADGGGQGLLAYGTDPADNKGKALRLRDRRALFSLDTHILALQATPQGLAVATPLGLLRLGADGSLKPLGFARAVRSLAYVDGVGLAAATSDGAWLLPPQGPAVAILSSPGVRLRARGADLYALLPAQGGILRLRGLGSLLP